MALGLFVYADPPAEGGAEGHEYVVVEEYMGWGGVYGDMGVATLPVEAQLQRPVRRSPVTSH
jgi:hypothetical protein